MYSNKIATYILTVFLLTGLLGIVYADNEKTNGTNNMSQSVNISANETNQPYQDHNSSTNSSKTNISDNVTPTGGIKIFMKDYKYQSNT
jgi:hypothetical protein